jgi:hypothetical protein
MPQDPLMDKHAKVALSATKNLHKRLRELEEESLRKTHNDHIDFKELKKLAAGANKAIQAMQRHASDDAVRADVRENILREAVRDELIDREANAARVHDKQRALSALEKANQTVAGVEASLASLCPHQLQRAPGVSVLAEAACATGA